MRIGKQFIRNFVIKQFRVFDTYLDVDRVDVIVRGKLLGFACADYEGFYYMWKEDSEHVRDARSAGQKLRKFVREWVRDVTEAIYARGLEYRDFGWCGDIQQLRNALDEELSDYCEFNEGLRSFELDYYDMVNDICLTKPAYLKQIRRYARV